MPPKIADQARVEHFNWLYRIVDNCINSIVIPTFTIKVQ
jgi:hypothetical protein